MILEVDTNFPQPGIVEQTIEILNKNKGILVYPTDTVYGLGCNAFDEIAVQKIKNFKQRDESKSFSLLFDSIKNIKKYCELTASQELVLEKYLPGPFTFILQSKNTLPQHLRSQKNTVAIRIPRNKLCMELYKGFNKPLITTSLNISGTPTLTNPDQLTTLQKNDIDIILDAGTLSLNPSTIIDLTTTPYTTLRQGKGVFKD